MAFSISDITLNGGHANEVVIHQINQLSHNQGIEVIEAMASGAPTQAANFQGNTQPVTSITSTDLATLLGLNSAAFLGSGYCADDATSVVPFNKRADCGVFESGSTHSAISAAKILLVPTQLSAQGAQAATLAVDLHYLSSAPATSSTTILSSQALTAATYVSAWQMSKVFIGGSQLGEVTGIQISPNFTVTKPIVNGGPFATEAYVTQLKPTITLNTENLAATLAVLNSATAGSGGCVIYLNKKAEGGTVVDPTTTAHISITALTGLRQGSDIQVNEGQSGAGTITITVNNPTPGSQVTLGVATGVAIP